MKPGASTRSGAATAVDPRLYRFGFLATEAPLSGTSVWSALRRAWPSCKLGPLTLHLHPEAVCRAQFAGERSVALIGDAYVIEGTLDAAMNDLARGASPPQVLDRLSGRFALIVADREGWRVYHDPFGSRTVFYREGAVASHAQLLAHATRVPRDPDIAAFIKTEGYQKRTVRYLPGDLTVHAGVHALAPNNGYDGAARATFRYWPREPRSPSEFPEFLDRLSASMRALAEHVRGARPVVGLTGGIDSRVIVAALRAWNVPFDGVTWEGGYLDEKERPVIAQLRPLAREHRLMKVNRREPADAVATVAGQNGGGYRGPARLVTQMAKVPEGVFIRGYGGEIARGFYNLWAKGPMSVGAANFLAKYTYGGIELDDTYLTVGERAFSGFIERANYAGVEEFGYEIADLFYWEHRMGMWGAGMLNEMDVAMKGLVGLNSRPMYQAALGLPRQERLTKQLLARAIDAICPELAGVPYF